MTKLPNPSSLFLALLASTPAPSTARDTSLDTRAFPDAPSGDYAPEIVDCPSSRPSVRLADSLSESEASWIQTRRNNTVDPIRRLLERANIEGFDAKSFIDNARDNATALPNIGIAVSGGGYRALMNGAGFLSAADSRNEDDQEGDEDFDEESTTDGKRAVSGLLQASTYLAGLSGGGWLVGSIFANNFSSVPDLQAGNSEDGGGGALWRFDRSIFRGPEESGIGALNTVDYWTDVVEEVGRKGDGWDTSVTDFWGRALSYQLIGVTDGGPAFTFSSIAETDAFGDGETPFPILVADGRAPDERLISLNATVYEFNPFELGTWDPTTYGFAPLRWLASNFTDGEVERSSDDDDGHCVRGFDNLGFVMGTSSSLFNQFLIQNVTAVGEDAGVPSFAVSAVESVLERLDRDENDIAQYAPNPFRDWDPTGESHNADEFQLSLVDGGEDLQNIPLHPLIQPMRALDVVFAVDSSADTDNNWPNGTALRATFDRAGSDIANGTLFPPVPSAETFVNRELNQRPTFFGCDADNFTADANSDSDDFTVPPLIVYIPNAPYTAHSNVSTFTPSYPLDERDAIIRNGFNAATQGNATVDGEWPVCVACAVMSRSWWKAGESAPEACGRCFDRYCWDGESDDEPVENYDPQYIVGADWEADEDGAVALRGAWGSVAVSLGVAVVLAVW